MLESGLDSKRESEARLSPIWLSLLLEMARLARRIQPETVFVSQGQHFTKLSVNRVIKMNQGNRLVGLQSQLQAGFPIFVAAINIYHALAF